MTAQVKQRIEMISSGEIPKGYTKTKLGILPIDWKVMPLKMILHNESRAVTKPDVGYWRLGLRSHAKGTFHEFIEDPSTVMMEELYEVKGNDFIVNITFAWEQAVAIASEDDEGKLVSHRFPTFVFDNGNNPMFYRYVIVQKWFKKMLDDISPGGAGRNRVMSKSELLKMNCIAPPVKEQNKIAEILTTCDKVIELKEKLVAEKKQQKKWLSNRFFKVGDGFSREKLSLLCQIVMGQSPNSDSYNYKGEGYPLIQGNADIENRLSKPRMFTIKPTKMCNPNDVLLTVRAPVGEVAKSSVKACLGRGMCAISAEKDTIEYLYQYLLYFENKWSNVSQGSTFEAICGNDIRNLSVPIYDLSDKILITNILTTKDKEIKLMQEDLTEWKNKKKALMQLLLTGKVRATYV